MFTYVTLFDVKMNMFPTRTSDKGIDIQITVGWGESQWIAS